MPLTEGEVHAAVERAIARANGKDSNADRTEVQKLATLGEFDYERKREAAASALGVRIPILDKMVKRARAEHDNTALPHWTVEPSANPVDGGELLDSLRAIFRRYIVLPKDADVALSLWVLHAWTMEAGDISPFMVLVSPTKRCGKTSVLILLQYLTPRSELASNITASALFRYIEEVKPTLLIDEADSFVRDNEELRGILNSGHTKAAAYVIRNVELNGEHRPRRFSTWAPKAIATIRALADTLEDRAVVLQLQRKPPGAQVERLRRRDNEEFGSLRSRATRWAVDNFDKLVDPEPQMPKNLNDRAADNWRPLLAIADLAGGNWPEEARQAAMTLSGEEGDGTANVELLRHIRTAFGDNDVIRSSDLVTKLTADPERPWADWKHGRALTQKQLGTLLKPFRITSTTVHPVGTAHGKGYRRNDFEEAWAAYCPGQNPLAPQSDPFEACKRASADEMGTSRDFRSVREDPSHGLKNDNLSYSYAGLHACTDRKAPEGAKGHSDNESDPLGDIPDPLRRCDHCGRLGPTAQWDWPGRPDGVWLHSACEGPWMDGASNTSA